MAHSVVEDEVGTVTPLQPRRWSRRLRSWRPVLLVVLVAGLVGFAAWVVLVSSWLGLRSVEVNGVHGVTVSQVTGAVAVAPGTPLARVDLAAVQSRVEAIPAVASATVHRGWPHTLVVTVTERTPVATLHADGRWWQMDRTGTLFGASSSPAPGQPIVEVDGSAGLTARQGVASVLGALPADLAAKTARVSAGSADSITLRLVGGAQVRWGSADESGEKAVVLRALLRHSASATFYDVSVPSQPATRG